MKTLLGDKVRKPRSDRQWRLAIVEDALKHLNGSNISRGEYLAVETYDPVYDYVPASERKWQFHEDDWNKITGDDPAKHFNTLMKKCQVCAKGFLFLEAVNMGVVLKDNRISDFVSNGEYVCSREDNTLSEALKYWDKDQLDLIETAFECCAFGKWDELGGEGERAIIFGRKYKTDRGRLRGILKNMLKNDGYFRP